MGERTIAEVNDLDRKKCWLLQSVYVVTDTRKPWAK
jgi:hypothetical protein